MAYSHNIVCFATSKKPSGRCVAGVTVDAEGEKRDWIRPVSDRPGCEVSLDERRYHDGTEPRLLDIITIPLLEPRPQHHQTENHLLDAGHYWERIDTLPASRVADFLETPATLWINGYRSSNGINDRVPEDRAYKELHSSLYLVEPTELVFSVGKEGLEWPKRKVRASFNYRGEPYRFMVTDLEIESKYLGLSDGTYNSSDRLGFCVSIAESFHGFCYKLVAGAMKLP